MQDNGKRQSKLRFSPENQVEPKIEPGKSGDSKPKRAYERAEKVVDKATEKLNKAKSRLPKQKAMTIARATDEATGKTAIRLNFEEKIKPPSKLLHEGLLTGRDHKSNVIAYQIRQSFRPGEITPEEANRIGYELAARLLKGKHAFIVATHVDKAPFIITSYGILPIWIVLENSATFGAAPVVSA